MKKRVIEYSFLILFIVGLVFLNQFLQYKRPEDYPEGIEYAVASVVSIQGEELGEDPDYEYITLGKQQLTLEIQSGKYKGTVVDCNNYLQRIINKPAKIGTKYIIASYDGFITTMIINYERSGFLYLFVALFLAVILIFGKEKGLKSVFSLAFTLICVFFLFVPLLLQGMEPVLAALLVIVLSTTVTMCAINGYTKKSLLAIVSCVICCMLAGLLALCMGSLSRISTLNTAEAENLLFITSDTGLNISNLLVAGILIAALGAIMDTCMSIVSSLYELKSRREDMSRQELIVSGFNIGRDIMGTMTNTLILAFAGGSINMILVYYMYRTPFLVLINTDIILVELIRGLSGSIAVVLSIPVTVVLTSMSLTHNKPHNKQRGHKEGKIR